MPLDHLLQVKDSAGLARARSDARDDGRSREPAVSVLRNALPKETIMRKPADPGARHRVRSAGHRHLMDARAPGRDGHSGPGPKNSWLWQAVLASTALTAGVLVALTSAPTAGAVLTPNPAAAAAATRQVST